MEKLINKLIKGEEIILKKGLVYTNSEENEEYFFSVNALLRKGYIHNIIEIYAKNYANNLSENNSELDQMECYSVENIYRLPFTKDKKLLEKMLKLVQENSHTDFTNQTYPT